MTKLAERFLAWLATENGKIAKATYWTTVVYVAMTVFIIALAR